MNVFRLDFLTGGKGVEGCDMLIDVYSSHPLLFCVIFVYRCQVADVDYNLLQANYSQYSLLQCFGLVKRPKIGVERDSRLVLEGIEHELSRR
jgi:hypothetical protein